MYRKKLRTYATWCQTVTMSLLKQGEYLIESKALKMFTREALKNVI